MFQCGGQGQFFGTGRYPSRSATLRRPMVGGGRFGHTGGIMNDVFFPASFVNQAGPAMLGLAAFLGAVIFLCGYHADRRHQK